VVLTCGLPSDAASSPIEAPDRTFSIRDLSDFRVQGRGDDQDRREVPQVDGYHRAVQPLDARRQRRDLASLVTRPP
jgi:hypothetical protein